MSTTQIHITLLDFKYLPKHYCDNIELYIYDLCKCMLQIKGPVAYGCIVTFHYGLAQSIYLYIDGLVQDCSNSSAAAVP